MWWTYFFQWARREPARPVPVEFAGDEAFSVALGPQPVGPRRTPADPVFTRMLVPLDVSYPNEKAADQRMVAV